jgi:hypothetical protein
MRTIKAGLLHFLYGSVPGTIASTRVLHSIVRFRGVI